MSLDTISLLKEQNRQWAQDVIGRDKDFFTQSAKGQQPKILWIGCADSRVPESVILECMPGAIFAHRNIANQVFPDDNNGMAVLKYAVEELRVEHIIVVGHSRCGGVAACYEPLTAEDRALCFGPFEKTSWPPSDPLTEWLAPLKRRVEELLASDSPPAKLQQVIDINVQDQVQKIIALPVVQNAWVRLEDLTRDDRGPEGERERKKLAGIHGWCYELETGLVRDLGVSVASPNLK
ncbi:hypothetical protein EIP86_008776 [Pleurotus ostreatoroseus]|nr:hypothetical protein EIP86_008776 [Pleurotus ostreatoroseus]